MGRIGTLYSEKGSDNLLLKTRQARVVTATMALILACFLLVIGLIHTTFASPDSPWLWAGVGELLMGGIAWLWIMFNLVSLRTRDSDTPTIYLQTANTITVVRVLSVPAMAYLLWITTRESTYGQKALLVAWLGAAILSDTLDGHIARRFNQVTQLGSYLDPMSDLSMALVLSFTLVMKNLLPWWVCGAIVLKVVTTTGAGVIYTYKKLAAPGLRSTIIGKASVVTIMASLLGATLNTISTWEGYAAVVLRGIYYLTALIVLLSIGEKIVLFKGFRQDWKASS